MEILFTTQLPLNGFSSLSAHKLIMPSTPRFSRAELERLITQCDVLVSTFDYTIDKALIDKAQKLKLIANFGVGFNNVDIDTASERHIVVTNTPDPVIEPTAEQTLNLMLAIAHRTAELDRKMRQTSDIKIGVMNNLGISIYGKTLGIVGLGRIGQAVAKRALACGMRIIYHNRQRLDSTIEDACKATYVSFDELLAESDFISLHVPYHKESHHLINDAAFQKMKKGATLINTARGAVVDEKSLIKNLKNGTLWGAALDVFEKEPVISPELFELDNVVLSPHIGTGTIDGRLAMCECVSDNILYFEQQQFDKLDWVNKF